MPITRVMLYVYEQFFSFKTSESQSMNISITYKYTISIKVSVTVRVRTFAGDIGTLSFGQWSRLSYKGNIIFINLQIIF